MIETAKYCQPCIDKLFPATAKAEKEKQFLTPILRTSTGYRLWSHQ